MTVPAVPDPCSRPPRRAGILLAALASLLALLAVSAAPAQAQNSPGPLLWTAPGGIDPRPLDAVACPSTSLCVAVDRGGSVLWSHHPANGPGSWRSSDVDGSQEITAVSCPSTALCIAVDAAGNVLTWPNPGTPGSQVVVAPVDTSKTQANTDNAGSVLLRGVSCPTTSLCVAVDAAGNALVSANPAGGGTTWGIIHIDNNQSYGCTGSGLACQPPLTGVACPSDQLCAAVDFAGNLLTTTDPASPSTWTSTQTYGGGLSSLYGISCPVTGFCATVNGEARQAITLNPAAPTTQTSRRVPDSLYGIWCQSQSLCLASAETPDGISGLVGSFNPSSPNSSWSLSSLGGVNGVACPTASLCLAVDDEGNIAAGATTTTIAAALTPDLLHPHLLPTIAALDRSGREKLRFTSQIAGDVSVAWTVPGPGGSRVTVGSASHQFVKPGRARFPLLLSAAGQQLFKTARGRVTLTATATFAAGTGSVSTVKKLTFSHPPTRKKR